MARETHCCPECGAKHPIRKIAARDGSIGRKIVELRQRHPGWPPSIIAVKANTNAAYVTQTLQRSGLPTKAVYDDE